MNLLTNTRHETQTAPVTPEPHAARRAVRYTATANAQAAIVRQFPKMFMAPLSQTVTTQDSKDGDVPQTAQ